MGVDSWISHHQIHSLFQVKYIWCFSGFLPWPPEVLLTVFVIVAQTNSAFLGKDYRWDPCCNPSHAPLAEPHQQVSGTAWGQRGLQDRLLSGSVRPVKSSFQSDSGSRLWLHLEGDKSEISQARLMVRRIMAHVSVATGVPGDVFPMAAAHLKAV